MSTTDSKTYITEQHAAGDSRDQIIIGLVTGAGMTLNAATRLYQDVAKAEGWTTVPTSHKDGCLDELRELYADNMAGWTAKAVTDAVVQWQADLGIAESTARDYCKAFSEEMGVPHPVRDYRTAIFEWFRDNAQSDLDEMKKAYIEFACGELKRSRSNANEYWKGYELHLYLAAE